MAPKHKDVKEQRRGANLSYGTKLEGSARYLGKMVGDGALQVEERKDES